MKTIVPIIILVALAVVGLSIYSPAANDMPQEEVMMESESMMDESMESEDVMMEDDAMTMESKTGSYLVYEDTDITSLEGTIVLNFSATWCPSCRSFKKDVEASLSDIPADLNLILVDYDSNTDLRKQYQVTSQHTFVHIDNQGNKINMWSGGNTLESVLEQIQ